MRKVRHLVWLVVAAVTLCGSQSLLAQTTAAGPGGGGGTNIAVVPSTGSTAGIPTGLQPLIKSFEQTRDKYLKQQELLLLKLKNTTTATEQAQIRAQLQTDRTAYLASLQGFRQQLQTQLTALKSKISHEEFLRIIDSAYNSATEGGLNHHKGH